MDKEPKVVLDGDIIIATQELHTVLLVIRSGIVDNAHEYYATYVPTDELPVAANDLTGVGVHIEGVVKTDRVVEVERITFT